MALRALGTSAMGVSKVFLRHIAHYIGTKTYAASGRSNCHRLDTKVNTFVFNKLPVTVTVTARVFFPSALRPRFWERWQPSAMMYICFKL